MKALLEKILVLTAAYRLEKNEWPACAAHLQAFASGLGRPLDFSPFHLLRFTALSGRELTLDFNFNPEENGRARCGRAWMKTLTSPSCPDDTLPVVIQIRNLAPRKVETREFCLLERK